MTLKWDELAEDTDSYSEDIALADSDEEVDYDGCLWIYRELYVNRLTADRLGQMIIEVEENDGEWKIYLTKN